MPEEKKRGDLTPNDTDASWVEFDILELEDARTRKKDPRSFSRIVCWNLCIMGPGEKGGSSYLATIVNMIILALNVAMLSYIL